MTLQKLWNIDPGYFRLKHAAKTIVAILITLWLMRNEALPFQLMSGIVSGFSMQGVVEKTGFLRVIQIVVLNVAYFLSFILGLAVRDSVDGTAITLVILGFVVNYLRRFGLQTSMAPMMAWSLCFFATTLPFASTGVVWDHSYAVVTALVVSALVNALIFPENYQRLFVVNSNRLFHALSQGMHEIRRHLVRSDQMDVFESSVFVGIAEAMSHLLESNQAMEEDEFFVRTCPHAGDILLQQYALVHAYMMMLDTYRTLNHTLLSSEERLALSELYRQFEHVFASMDMRKDYEVLSNNAWVSLAFLGKKLTRPPAPESIIVLLNLKLGFNLFNRHIAHLLRRSNES